MSFTERTKAPFRLDVVGSFLRPDAIKEARAAYADGAISAEQLKAVEDRCITELVEKELAAGLRCVTDGEFRRSYWHLDFMWGFEGVEHIVGEHGYFFHDEETRADTGRIVAPIRFNGHPFLEHFKFLRDLVGDRAIPRQTIPAPAQFYNEMLRGTNCDSLDAVYPTREAFREDLIKAYSDFIHALYEAGCRSLQLDDCTWGMFCDKTYWEARQKENVSVDEEAERYLRLNNLALAGAPEDLVITTHVCRGNYHSAWASSGGYEPIGKYLFSSEHVSAFYLEFDDERSGGFEPLRFVSDDKKVVLGLITTKSPVLEDKAQVIARIHEAARYVPLDRLYLSPQCGFASCEIGNRLTEEDQWAKLALVKEIAEEVWG